MNELLKELADHDRHLEAPDAVELRLRAAFRKQHSRRVWPYFALAIAAAIALVVFLVPRPKEQTMQIVVLPPPVVNVPTAKMLPVMTRQPKAVQPREIVTEFYPLVDGMPFDRGEIFRVELPAIAMRRVGLPVSEDHIGDRVQADVLVGEEGLARAVRFVRLER